MIPENMHVCVTRPKESASQLCRSIERLGAQALNYPCISLEKKIISSENIRRFGSLCSVDIVVVLSAHALNFLDGFWPQKCPRVIAIGQRTKSALEAQGICVEACASPQNSEGLLALDSLQHINGCRVVVLSGDDPRRLVHLGLLERGALVWALCTYKRVPIERSYGDDWPRLKSVNIVTATSVDCIEAFVLIFKEHASDWLKQLICVACGERVAQWCRLSPYFSQIVVADGASDEAIVASLESLYRETE